MKTVLVLGVTGGIACGKSLVTSQLIACGAVAIDADQLAREVVSPGTPGLRRLVERFGAEILSPEGGLDRVAMADRIFADATARADLNRMLHPAIAELAVSRLATLRAEGKAPLIVYEAALLFEVGAETRVDKVVVVSLPETLQVQRLMLRDGLDAAAARARIAAQMPLAEKVARGDFVIDNSGSVAATGRQVATLFTQLTGKAPGCQI